MEKDHHSHLQLIGQDLVSSGYRAARNAEQCGLCSIWLCTHLKIKACRKSEEKADIVENLQPLPQLVDLFFCDFLHFVCFKYIGMQSFF